MQNNVLYRKYRPKKYAEVVGQQINLQILKNIVINDEKVHALLFCGTRGTGKTTLAKIFARSLLCENFKEKQDLCLSCEQCKKQENENFSIIEIDAASNNGVEEVRNIRENIEIGTDSGKKIYIIDEVHMFSKSAFNALLKTIEEPPPNVYFVLATTEDDKIPDTILSRCLKLDFMLNNQNELIEYFQKICELEKINLTSEAVELVVQNANGSIRDGLSILEKIKMYAGEELQQLDDHAISKIIGVIPVQKIKQLTKAIENHQSEDINQIVDEISTQSFATKNFLEQLIIEFESTKIENKIKNQIFDLYLEINKIHSNQLFFIKLKDVLKSFENPNFMNTTKTNIQETPKVEIVQLDNLDQHQLDKLNRIIEIEIDKILESATKQDKTTAKNKLEKLKNYLSHLEYVHIINCINEKCELVAASANGIILVVNSHSVVSFLEENKEMVNHLLSNVYSYQLGYHVLVEEEWQTIRQEYVEKIKLKKQIEQARKDLLEVFNEKK